MKFIKMHGIGNDYIYVDGIHQDVNMDPNFITKISDRHTGIGSDGMIVILPSEKYDFKMRMFNADGSEGKMCGNGIRCFAKFVYDQHLTDKTTIEVETLAGVKTVRMTIKDGKMISACVDMGEPIFDTKLIPVLSDQETLIDQPMTIGDTTYQVSCISMGNPHCITFMDKIDDLDLVHIGKPFEKDPQFPESVNTEFVQIIDPHNIKMRVWERGSGETMACGTGACAAAVATMKRYPEVSKVSVELLGGRLDIEWKDDNHIYMTGPATTVFVGEIDEGGIE